MLFTLTRGSMELVASFRFFIYITKIMIVVILLIIEQLAYLINNFISVVHWTQGLPVHVICGKRDVKYQAAIVLLMNRTQVHCFIYMTPLKSHLLPLPYTDKLPTPYLIYF